MKQCNVSIYGAVLVTGYKSKAVLYVTGIGRTTDLAYKGPSSLHQLDKISADCFYISHTLRGDYLYMNNNDYYYLIGPYLKEDISNYTGA